MEQSRKRKAPSQEARLKNKKRAWNGQAKFKQTITNARLKPSKQTNFKLPPKKLDGNKAKTTKMERSRKLEAANRKC